MSRHCNALSVFNDVVDRATSIFDYNCDNILLVFILFILMYIIANRNEAEVGHAIKTSGILRPDIFVVTKIHWHDHGYERCKAGFADSLKK